jgi:GTPase
MADYQSQSPVAAMRATVQSIEAKLRQGHLPQDGLDDLKSAIDDARLRLWAVITAAGSPDPDAVLRKFKLRRATEICRGLTADLETGTLGADQRELLDLRDAARAMVERLDAAIRGAR